MSYLIDMERFISNCDRNSELLVEYRVTEELRIINRISESGSLFQAA